MVFGTFSQPNVLPCRFQKILQHMDVHGLCLSYERKTGPTFTCYGGPALRRSIDLKRIKQKETGLVISMADMKVNRGKRR